MSIIELANRTLTTPALIDCVQRFPEQITEDVRRYINEIFDRNGIRNDRLTSQLGQAVRALNSKGITPVLLKGAAMLAAKESARSEMRLISDLDILVAPHETVAALDCLFSLGYRVHYQSQADAPKWYADLKRPEDVGMVDLHQALPGHAFFYRPAGEVKQFCRLVGGEGGSAYVPSPTYQALMLIVHDQFQDSDYWIGAIDLRHLLDLRNLVASTEGIDWDMLASLASSKLVRNAFETQFVTLFSLLGVAAVPGEMRKRWIPWLQFRRRLLQARFPAFRHALLAMVLIDYWNYRAEIGREERIAKHQPSRMWVLPKLDSMRFLLELSRERRLGKV